VARGGQGWPRVARGGQGWPGEARWGQGWTWVARGGQPGQVGESVPEGWPGMWSVQVAKSTGDWAGWPGENGGEVAM